MQTKHFGVKLSLIIEEEYENYDGFVVTMGTNTLAYCSSALSFSLQGIGKPVCVTGAQIPSESSNTDAKNNLVNSVQIATLNISGVYVVFGSRIILGARAKKVSGSSLDAFVSFNTKEAGEIGIGTFFHSEPPVRHSSPLKANPHFEDAICSVTLVSGIITGDFQIHLRVRN